MIDKSESIPFLSIIESNIRKHMERNKYNSIPNRIKEICNADITQIALLIIMLCLSLICTILDYYNRWNTVALITSVFGCAILSSWVIWLIYSVYKNPVMNMMPHRPKIVIGIFNILMLIYSITIGLLKI